MRTPRPISPPASEAAILARLKTSVHVSAGPHVVGITFLKKTSALTDGIMQPFLRSNFDTQEQRGVPFVESISIGGPFDATGAGDTPSRRRIFVCRPQKQAEEIPCAKKILAVIERRAYRQPADGSGSRGSTEFLPIGQERRGFQRCVRGWNRERAALRLHQPRVLVSRGNRSRECRAWVGVPRERSGAGIAPVVLFVEQRSRRRADRCRRARQAARKGHTGAAGAADAGRSRVPRRSPPISPRSGSTCAIYPARAAI